VIKDETERRGHKLPLLLLTDGDPHGLDIARCFMLPFHGLQMTWLGVNPVEHQGLSSKFWLRITERERQLIKSLESFFSVCAEPKEDKRVNQKRYQTVF